MSEQEKEDKKNRKLPVALALVFASVVVVVGVAFAFFSDVITGNGTATAGTLDLTGSFTLTQYNAAGASQGTGTSIANFNPGDVINIAGAADNTGNKSASVRCEFALSGALVANSGNDKVKVVAGTVTTATGAESAIALTATSGNTYHTDVGILNGTGEGAESENGGVSSYSCSISVYFPKAASNDAQGDSLAIDAKIQGIQYRNNTTPDWTSVVNVAFGS
jgi:hypothetical protein